MKKILAKTCLVLAIILAVSSFGAFPAAYAEQPTAEEQTLAFVKDVLPLDWTKYEITTKILDIQLPIGGKQQQSVRCTLTSADGIVKILCSIQNNSIVSCQITEIGGLAVLDKQYDNLVDAAKSFLEKYQNFTKTDSTNLKIMLDDVDVSKDSSVTKGNSKLTISHATSPGDDLTSFTWAYTVNGASYTKLQLGFQKNGFLHTFYDSRTIYSIGDTTVNISNEQAIDIAMNYLPSYSYEMPDHTFVSNFNITENKTTTELLTSPVDSLELRPYWDVKLYLNQTYPGSVKGFVIFVWANSGEIISCSPIATGGVPDFPDSSNSTATPSLEITIAPPDTTNLPSSLQESNSSSPDMLFAVAIAVAAIIAVTAAVFRKKSK